MPIRDEGDARYLATPMLSKVIDEQGRRRVWMGQQIGISRSSVSRVLSGERTVAERDARRWATILGTPFDMLWKFASANKYARICEQETAA